MRPHDLVGVLGVDLLDIATPSADRTSAPHKEQINRLQPTIGLSCTQFFPLRERLQLERSSSSLSGRDCRRRLSCLLSYRAPPVVRVLRTTERPNDTPQPRDGDTGHA